MNPLFSHNATRGYIQDILRNYGDRGRPMQLPEYNDTSFQQGLAYRQREKQYYAALERRLKDAENKVAKQYDQLTLFATFINDKFLQTPVEDAAGGSGDGGGEPGGDGVADVLPAARDTRKNDTAGRKKQVTISGAETVKKDEPEPTDDSAAGSGSNGADEQPAPAAGDAPGQGDGGAEGARGADLGGSTDTVEASE